jgi:multiple sugar transport system permease protein
MIALSREGAVIKKRPFRTNVPRILLIVVMGLFSLMPLYTMFSTSFKVQNQIFDPDANLFSASYWLFTPTLENYQSVLIDGNFGRYLTNSLIVGIVSTILTLVLALLAAYALARFQFMGRGIIAWSSLLLRTVPLAVLAVPVFGIWQDWKLDGTVSGLILLYTAVNIPFAIWVLYGFIIQVPIELEEAAAIDGASSFRILYSIILPLIRPGLAAAGIFVFRIAWNEFILALVLTNRFSRTMPVEVAANITDVGVEWGRVMAMGVLIAIPPLIFALLAARQLIAGLTAGAVKG